MHAVIELKATLKEDFTAYPDERRCVVDGCDKNALRRNNKCSMHVGRWQRHGSFDRIPRSEYRRTPAPDRFWAKVNKTDGCWLWTGASSGFGYGSFWDGERRLGAHRYSYRVNIGPIPDGLSVLHRCDNPKCVRPDHFFLGTQADNAADMARKGRAHGGKGVQ